MPIVWDAENERMMDTENGDYLQKELKIIEHHLFLMVLRNKKDDPYVVAYVKNKSEKEFEVPGGGGAVRRWALQEAWIPDGRPVKPTNFKVPDAYLQRMALFLECDLKRNTQFLYMPRFEFVDERVNKGDAK